MKALFLTFFTTAVLFAASCRKSDYFHSSKASVEIESRSKATVGLPATSSKEPANPANPYDHIGRKHNTIILSLAGHTRLTNDTSRSSRRAFVIGYGKKNLGTDASRAIEAVERRLNSCQWDLNKLLATEPVSAACKEDIRRLFEILEGLKAGIPYNEIHSSIVSIEQQIMEKKYPQNELRLLLVTTAVARHSGWLWDPVAAGTQRFFLVNWAVTLCRYFASVHTDTLAIIGGIFMGLGIDDLEVMAAEESEGAANGIDNYWGDPSPAHWGF